MYLLNVKSVLSFVTSHTAHTERELDNFHIYFAKPIPKKVHIIKREPRQRLLTQVTSLTVLSCSPVVWNCYPGTTFEQ